MYLVLAALYPLYQSVLLHDQPFSSYMSFETYMLNDPEMTLATVRANKHHICVTISRSSIFYCVAVLTAILRYKVVENQKCTNDSE